MRGPPTSSGRHSDRKSAKGWQAAVARLVAAQHGVVARAQLKRLGFTESAIKHWIAIGRLRRVERGIYAVSSAPLSREGRWMTAVLAYGPAAVLSHLSAAAHWGLLQTAQRRIDVSLPSHLRSRSRNGIRLHRTRLDPADIRRRKNIPVTSWARTLLDLADVVPPARVREAFEQSQRMGLFDLRELLAVLDRGTGRRGLGILRALLAEAGDGPPELRSGLERDFRELLRAAGLPLPQTNVVVEGLTVDCYWPHHKLVVELDSYGYHRSREAFEHDHEATERLTLAGLAVLRFTRERVLGQPAAVERAVRASLERGEI